MEKIYEMLQLQNELNNDTNGAQWRDGTTKNGKPINWKRCIYMESAELIDSFPWKHWKSIDAKPNFDNIKIELVDIWHFIMSYLLKLNELQKCAVMIDNAKEAKSDVKLPKEWNRERNAKIDEYLDIFEELMALGLVKSDSEALQEELLEVFFKACDAAHLDFDELYRIYIGKNALNQFRQEHGYKEGTYKKSWGGKEDNEVLQEILEQTPDITFAALKAELARRYATL